MSFIPLDGLQQSSKKVAMKKALRSETDGGYTFSRALTTKVKYKFTLDFTLTKTQFSTLETFFISNQGANFSLLFDGNTYTVIFNQDELDYSRVAYDIYKLNINLVEV